MLNKKVMIVSLGCDKNLVDTEKMLGILADEGCTFTDDEAQAQVIIVNTCCFIGDAKEESIQNILDLARFKTEGKGKRAVLSASVRRRAGGSELGKSGGARGAEKSLRILGRSRRRWPAPRRDQCYLQRPNLPVRYRG